LQDRLLYRWVLKQLPVVIFVCGNQRDYWISKYPELKSTARVVYNGVDPKRFRRGDFEVSARELRDELAIPPSAFVFACIAAFRPEKGHKLLIEAFAKQSNHVHLLLAGDGALQSSSRNAVSAAGLENRVHFLGNVPDIRPVIVASNATVLASTAVETFSMAMLESMALEVPMLATAIGGMAEAIVHGETGLLCGPGDTQALATQMQFLVEHESVAYQMGRAAAEMVARRFTLDRMLADNQAVLDAVLEAARAVRMS
jgi:glycosyltransferase involved in cell wall biosynthesis